MKNILLVDDEAQNGWSDVLKVTVFKDQKLDYAETKEDAREKLTLQKYDLILLDLRFGQDDHVQVDIENFGGFEILTSCIRNEFASVNFATPVMIFTASNKVWHIYTLLERGADDYYIKEHPTTMRDLEFSRANYKRLLTSITELNELGRKRSTVWNLIMSIQTKLSESIDNENIKSRIRDKLRVGYATLFSKPNLIEKSVLLKSNEILAYIILWSILEEIAKDSFQDSWVRIGQYEGNMIANKWIFKNGGILSVPMDNSDDIEVGIKYDPTEKYWFGKKVRVSSKNWEYSKLTGRIDLSYQITGYMLLCKRMEPFIIKAKFNPLRDFRNKTAYTHSSIESIFQEPLSTSEIRDEAYKKCLEMLKFLEEIIG